MQFSAENFLFRLNYSQRLKREREREKNTRETQQEFIIAVDLSIESKKALVLMHQYMHQI